MALGPNDTNDTDGKLTDANNDTITKSATDVKDDTAAPLAQARRQDTPREGDTPSTTASTAGTGNAEPNAAPEQGWHGLTAPNVIGSALGAATALVLSTQIGIAGSVLGAVIASIVSNVSAKVYESIMRTSADVIATKAQEHAMEDNENGTDGQDATIEGGSVSDTLVMPHVDYDYDGVSYDPYDKGNERPKEKETRRKGKHADNGKQGKLQALLHDKKAMVTIVSVIAALITVAIVASIITAATNGNGLGTKPTYHATQTIVTNATNGNANDDGQYAPIAYQDKNGRGHGMNANANANANANSENASSNANENATNETSDENATPQKEQGTNGVQPSNGSASGSSQTSQGHGSQGQSGTGSDSGQTSPTNGSGDSSTNNGSSNGNGSTSDNGGSTPSNSGSNGGASGGNTGGSGSGTQGNSGKTPDTPTSGGGASATTGGKATAGGTN